MPLSLISSTISQQQNLRFNHHPSLIKTKYQAVSPNFPLCLTTWTSRGGGRDPRNGPTPQALVAAGLSRNPARQNGTKGDLPAVSQLEVTQPGGDNGHDGRVQSDACAHKGDDAPRLGSVEDAVDGRHERAAVRVGRGEVGLAVSSLGECVV